MEDNLHKDLEKLSIDHSKTHGSTSSKSRVLILFAGLIIIICLTFYFFKDFIVSNKQVSIITVTAQHPEESTNPMTAGGYIVAESEITVSSKVAGRIVTLPVREGDLVAKGDILATLENEELRVQMEEAEANLEKAELNLKHKQELYQKDVIDLQRRRELFQGKLISPSQFDK